jgi:hypothetical protein
MGELPAALLDEAIETLERLGCQFGFCDGPTLEPVDMKTCYACEMLAKLRAYRAGQAATPDRPRELVSRLSKRIADLRAEAGEEFCNCESYDKCYGECCGIGNCTCTADATPDGPRTWALPDDREKAQAAIHRPLHDLNVRIVALKAGDCHCNLIAEAVLDALTAATPAADRQDGDGRDG